MSCSLLGMDYTRYLRACQKKVFKLKPKKFGQNMHKIHSDKKQNTAGCCDFQRQWYWSFKIFLSQKFSAIWQTVFFFLAKKLAKQTILVSGQHKFARISQGASNTYKKYFMVLPLIWRLQWKYLQVSVYAALTVFVLRLFNILLLSTFCYSTFSYSTFVYFWRSNVSFFNYLMLS